MTPITITLQGLPSDSNSHKSGWLMASLERKKWRKLVAKEAQFLRPLTPFSKCEIICTRYSSVKPDYDNLVISFKCIDGLKDAFIIEDDNDACVVRREYRHEKVAPKEGRITITVIGHEMMSVDDFIEMKRKINDRVLKNQSKRRSPQASRRKPGRPGQPFRKARRS